MAVRIVVHILFLPWDASMISDAGPWAAMKKSRKIGNFCLMLNNCSVLYQPAPNFCRLTEDMTVHVMTLEICGRVTITIVVTLFPFSGSLHGLTLMSWRSYGLCLWHKLTELARSVLFCSCDCFCLYGLFNCISFHRFSQQLSVFFLCSSCVSSALLVLSTTFLFMKVSFSPDIIPRGCLGSR